MQVNNQDLAVRQYAQATQSAKATVANSANAEVSQVAPEASAVKPDVDRVELSKDTDITKMSEADRNKLVDSLKADLDKFMASGNYTVDAKTKAEAEEAISEDGFWGVKQTSQRIFDFAKAVAGDDVDTMKKMQAAVEKGFEQAGAAWGGDLPSICGDTHEAVGKLFDEYYASR